MSVGMDAGMGMAMRWALVAGLALAGVTAPARAREPLAAGTDCATAAWPLETARARLSAPSVPEVENGGALDPKAGAVALVLRPQPEVTFAHPPERANAGPEAFAGTFSVAVARAGLWQLTLSGPAWVDMVEEGRLVPVTAFTGVHRCPGVRKSLRFQLTSGKAILQLSAAPSGRVRILLAPLD